MEREVTNEINVYEKEAEENPAWQYAGLRNVFYRKGFRMEMLSSFEPRLRFFYKWWTQLFAESEGKEGLGLFPVTGEFSEELHSVGQFIQDGARLFFETVLWVEKANYEITVPEDPANVDGLNFVSGKSLQYMDEKAMNGTLLAHVDGGVPNLIITLDELSDYTFGEVVYFFWKALGISGYCLGVNPFDQPGVEEYKNNMFALLGKPGYEGAKADLEARLKAVL